MRVRRYKYFACDFETTVYEGQDYTEVWLSGCIELYSDNPQVFHSLSELFNYFKSLNCNIIAYFHNLKFDGSFWLDYLLLKIGYKQAVEKNSDSLYDVSWLHENKMPNKSFKYSVSDIGQWYTIVIKENNHYIEIRDSLKLIPFSIEEISRSFDTQHKKLHMEYKGFRYAGCKVSKEDMEYFKGDLYVLKEALEIMFNDGHDKLTIGSCCLSEYKNICKSSIKNQLSYEEMFPNIYDIELNGLFDENSAGEWVRKSYKGAWCYLKRGKANKLFRNGLTADVNSLYSSVMHSESGNVYPIGKPHFWVGNYIPDSATYNGRYYFVRIKTRFYLKDGYLPFIQIKSSFLYKGNECLESSDIYDKETKSYYSNYIDAEGNYHDTRVELTLTMTDYELLKDHYNLVDFEILGGCWFYGQIGIFDEYIDKYKKIKIESKGAKRTLAKLYLNNLYGKLATSTDSSFKYAFIKDGGVIGFISVHEEDKTPGYIPCGSAITSYARNFTIRASQKNYNHFIYADTDSMHLDCNVNDVSGISIDDSAFCCWKIETCWDYAIFARQKTYIEHVTRENLKEVNPYYNIKCAGMPDRCKNLLLESITGNINYREFTEQEKEFLFDQNGGLIRRDITDFKKGIRIPGKLMPKRIPGGIVLKDTYYEMR